MALAGTFQAGRTRWFHTRQKMNYMSTLTSPYNNVLIRSGEALGIGWSRNMLYSGLNNLHRSVIRRQTGFAARITRTLFGFKSISSFQTERMNLRQQVQSNAAKIVELRRRVLETCIFRDDGAEQKAEWKQASSEFHEHYYDLAFPGGVFGARDRMRAGDEHAIEYAIAFLEVRPFFFRFGYMYQEYMRVLRN